jgi:type I restriction enzyme R subunit
LVEKLNDVFGLDLTEADQLTFEQWEQRLVEDETLAVQAKANDMAHYGEVFPAALDNVVIEQLLQDERIAKLIQDDPDFKEYVVRAFLERVYRKQRGEDAA